MGILTMPQGTILNVRAVRVVGYVRVELDGQELFSATGPSELVARPLSAGTARIDATATRTGDQAIDCLLAFSVGRDQEAPVLQSQMQLTDEYPGKSLVLQVEEARS